MKNAQVKTNVYNNVSINLHPQPNNHLPLKSVLSGYSNSSRDDIANTFKAMCTDSQIAKDFKLGRLKLMYIVNYGIAPYFKQLLDVKLKKLFYTPCLLARASKK